MKWQIHGTAEIFPVGKDHSDGSQQDDRGKNEGSV